MQEPACPQQLCGAAGRVTVVEQSMVACRVRALSELRCVADEYAVVAQRRKALAREARAHGASWGQIARALGVNRACTARNFVLRELTVRGGRS